MEPTNTPQTPSQFVAPEVTPPSIPDGTPATPGAPTTVVPAHEPAFVAPLIGVLIFVLVLVLGGLYLWGSARMGQTVTVPEATLSETPEAVPASTDEFAAIEAELDASFSSMDDDFSDIDAVLDESASAQ